MRYYLIEVLGSIIAYAFIPILLLILILIGLPYFILASIFSKPLTEEEKKNLEQEHQNRYRQSLPIRCGCCAGQHRGLSSTN
ncbi:MAG: hypothetical protein ACK5B3_02375 [Bacteroidota bacterium]|jgi:hypothetical protein